jgi:uncharacterized protein YpbB
MIWLISKLDLLTHICENPYLSSWIARWKMLLEKYDIVFITRKTVKKSVFVDHLIDIIVEDYKLLNFDLPNEDVLMVEDDSGTNV